jgi:chemotaxis receptor (MCP) glutamine deamidase CheD
MEALYNRMCEAIRASGTIPQLKAKLFGGADIKRDGASVSDGKQSVAFSRNWLRTRNIPILNESVGGAKRREVILLSGSGTVYCKQVSMNSEFLERERNALLPVSTPLNHVELF